MITSLPSAVNATLTDTHYYFYGVPSTFSNWYCSHCQIKMRGLSFESSEQCFMFLKARFFGDLDIAAAAHKETDPKAVKALGRAVKGYVDEEWICVREGLMAYTLYLKYTQNSSLGAELLSTGNRIIVEASPYDLIWGVGLNHNDPLILDPANWRGANLLGKALMTVRGLINKGA